MIDRRRAAFAALAATPLLLLASACKDGGSSPFGLAGRNAGEGQAAAGGAATPAEPSAKSPIAIGGDDGAAGSDGSSSASVSDASALSGSWTGQYVCNQGPTKLTLLLEGAGSGVAGTFKFSGLSGSTAPSGSYTVNGTLSGGELKLQGETWLSQPSGYVMVDLDVTTITPTTLSGTVDGAGCSTFQVTRTGR